MPSRAQRIRARRGRQRSHALQPLIDFLARLILGVAVPLLDLALELIATLMLRPDGSIATDVVRGVVELRSVLAPAVGRFAAERRTRDDLAPIAAVVSLGTSYGQRLRRVVEVTAGVAIGVFLGDLLVLQVGTGFSQTGPIGASVPASGLTAASPPTSSSPGFWVPGHAAHTIAIANRAIVPGGARMNGAPIKRRARVARKRGPMNRDLAAHRRGVAPRIRCQSQRASGRLGNARCPTRSASRYMHAGHDSCSAGPGCCGRS